MQAVGRRPAETLSNQSHRRIEACVVGVRSRQGGLDRKNKKTGRSRFFFVFLVGGAGFEPATLAV